MLRRVAYRKSEAETRETLVDKEWLVTNGLGGYASGSLAGVITRGFHGYLVAALPTPLGRMMMLNDLIEKVGLPDGQSVQLSGEERVNAPLKAQGAEYLEEFCLEDGVPVWIFRFGEILLEKRVLMVHRQNTVHVNYRLKSGDGGENDAAPIGEFPAARSGCEHSACRKLRVHSDRRYV